jgi:uncharacterized protein (TIGR04141 family)
MAKRNERASPLSLYLLRPDRVNVFEKVLRTESQGLPLADGWDGYILTMQSARKPPAWEKLLKPLLRNSGGLSLSGESPGALLVIRLSGKTFVLAFGHAWTKLQDEWLEQSFGRRVALNSIDPGKLVEVNLEQVFAKWHVARERAPRASSVDEFDVEFDRDLVASIEGISSKKIFGKKLRGSTNLRVDVPFSELRRVLESAGRHFDSDEYKKRWPEIDNIDPTDDEALILDLEAQLDLELKSGKAQKTLVMFTPTYRHDVDKVVDSYVFGRRTQTAGTRPYLMVESWENYLKERDLVPTVANAKDTPVHLLTGGDEDPRRSSAFQCFGYELSFNQKEYVLSSGVWYEVASDFLRKINSEVATIPFPRKELPDWRDGETEPQYNTRCGQIPGFLSMDAKHLMFGGDQSKFEFCDVLHLQSKTLYFAKIPSKSSGMSHLLEQTRRTAELFFAPGDSAYRKALARVIKAHHKGVATDWLENKPKNGDWNLCLVSLGRRKENLPFFAKCGVARLCRELRRQGHEVSFLKV